MIAGNAQSRGRGPPAFAGRIASRTRPRGDRGEGAIGPDGRGQQVHSDWRPERGSTRRRTPDRSRDARASRSHQRRSALVVRARPNPPGAPVTWRFEHRGAAGTGINRHQASVRLLHQLLHVAQGCNRPDRAPRPRTLAWYGPRHRRGTRDALRAGRGDPRGRLRHCDDRDRRIALWWVSLSSPSAGRERRTRDSVTQEWRGRSGAAPICTTPSPRGARAASCASTSAVVMSARLRLPPTRNVARPEPRSVRRCA